MDGTAFALVAAAFVVGFILGRLGKSAPAGPAQPVLADAAALESVRPILASGNKIAAIKAYREATGAGLHEAKLAVESLEGPRPSS